MNFNFGINDMLKAIRKYIGPPFDTYFVILLVSVSTVSMLQLIGLEFDTVLVFQTIILVLLLVAFWDILWQRKWILIVGCIIGLLYATLRQLLN